MSDVSVVIPNFNRAELLARAIESVKGQSLPRVNLIVVDNGSRDDSVAIATRLGATVVESEVNLGFSRAVNLAIERCETKWVLVLNNDAFLAQDCIERLCTAAQASGADLVAPLVLSDTDLSVVDATFDLMASSGCALRVGHGEPLAARERSARPVLFAPFTAVLLNAEMFRRLGGLSEEMATYMEDIDYCLRLALAGGACRFEPSAVAYHRGSATDGAWSPRMVRQISRNQLLLVARHWPRPMPAWLKWNVLAGQALWALAALRHGALTAWLGGKWAAKKEWEGHRNGEPGGDAFYRIVSESETELRRLAEGWYWRAYFALARRV